ncbi:holo-ACP synthase [Longibaculum muris]|uniref:holo-ACP synthase n=1 Tax=Longibaculum muris TaxID=1796628 RepID=UPI0012B6B796|nr:holo-ACP synthase [Longibaculum muris]
MKGIGVDIIDLERLDIENVHFVKRVLSDKEYQLFLQMNSSKRRLEFLGGRFAGKEAYLKANHKGLGGIDFHDIEILNHDDGSPYLNDENACISISHENKYAIAFVMIEK